MAGFSPSIAALLLAALLVPASSAGAQSARRAAVVAGRVVRVAAAGDTLPVSAAVVLHRVSRAAQGPLDTTATTPGGRFGFRFFPDSGATYLVSVRWAGIEYFSDALSADPARTDTAVVVVVADTSSSVPVRVAQRTVLIGAPDASGFRAVLDWFALSNTGGLTRVAADSTRPVWAAPLPSEAEDPALADTRLSVFSPEAVLFERDSVAVWAPISPGQRELLLRYRLPPDQKVLRLPLGAGSDSLHVFLEEPSARIRTGGLTAGPTQTIEQRSFRRWSGVGAPAATIEVAFSSTALTPGQVVALLVAAAALSFAGLAALLLRRGRVTVPAASPLALADRIARLDLRYAGREADIAAEEWRRYQEDRARLREELARALAGRPRHS